MIPSREWLLLADPVARAFRSADARLRHYLRMIEGVETPQAVHARLSMETKKVHCQGGVAFACLSPRRVRLISAIVGLQAISDYLDNLCDRMEPPLESRHRQLHVAMRAAVDPQATCPPVPEEWPGTSHGGLLWNLVSDTRESVSSLPSYHVVQPGVRRLVDLYVDLQSLKHLPPGQRERALQDWYAQWRTNDRLAGHGFAP